MNDPMILVALAGSGLTGLGIATFAGLKGWQGWLDLKRLELAGHRASEGRSPAIDAQRERMRAKVILKFHEKVDSLLVSGLLANGDELNNKPAVVDAPVGKGHVILFSIRPLWRWQSQGTFALALNAIANWNHLDF